MSKDVVIDRLRRAMRAAISEARKDPEFLGKVVTTVCSEFGLDPMASLYISGKLKNVIRKKDS